MFERNDKRGFTLAELLIVVAIIAVLVAIAIPVFTSQLEKSREAVDEANIRSLYAETVAAVLGNDATATTTLAGAKLKVLPNTDSRTNGIWVGNAQLELTHQKPGLEGKGEGDNINIGGVNLPASSFPTASDGEPGMVYIQVKSDGDDPFIGFVQPDKYWAIDD